MNTWHLSTLVLITSASIVGTPIMAGGLASPMIEVVQPSIESGSITSASRFSGLGVYGGLTFGSNNYDVVGKGELSETDFDFNLPDLGGTGIGGMIGVGYDFQPTDRLIYGVFLDYSSSNVANDTSLNIGAPVATSAEYDLTQASALTIGGRFGYVPSTDSLVYGLLGYTHAEWEGEFSFGGSGDSYNFDNKGLTIGFGMETFVADNLTLRIEYRHTSFDNYELIRLGNDIDNITVDLETKSQAVGALVSYRF